MSDCTWRVLVGDVREQLAELPDASVQCVVTSPPYWGLRDYGMPGQIGLESCPDDYVRDLAAVFHEVRRVLRHDGTLWLTLGDSYCTTPRGNRPGDLSRSSLTNPERQATVPRGRIDFQKPSKQRSNVGSNFAGPHRLNRYGDIKGKDLVGIPWLVAFALRADGWYLRADVIWSKPNPMPESVTDRPTKSHEYLFLLTKSARYYYDAEAIKEPCAECTLREIERGYNGHATKDDAAAGAQTPGDTKRRIIENARRKNEQSPDRRRNGFNERWDRSERQNRLRSTVGRNARSVWTIHTQPYAGAHFATFPEALPERCIKAGSSIGDTVLDPFCGSGTTGQVAIQLGRSFIGVELNPEYAELARKRIGGVAPLFATAVVS